MAKCKVTLRRFKPDLVGYTKAKDAGGVQAILASKAQAVKGAADSLSRGSHRVEHRQGKFDMGYYVVADDFDARLDQSRLKTLTKACNSIGSGS